MPTKVRDRLEAALDAIAGSGAAASTVMAKVHTEAARAAADAADARARLGLSLGALDGALVSIKDLLDEAGEVTTAGSRINRDLPPAKADAPVVRRLRAAGAVIVGRTTMSEFAYSGIGINPHTGTPGNAADPTRVPGGSSSGAAVSVGRGWADIAIGSDTGGSIRIPSAFNGLVGFKPGGGRVPTEGAFPLSYTLDTIGPIARRVADTVAADAVLSGVAAPPSAPVAAGGLRLAVPRGFLYSDLDGIVGPAVEAALGLLAKAGIRLFEVDLDAVVTLPLAIQKDVTITAIEAAHIHRDNLRDRAGDFDPRVLARIEKGAQASGATYVGMIRAREAAKAAVDAAFAPFDAVIAPTVPAVAPVIADLVDDDAAFTRANLTALRNTAIFNLFDLPAYSLPIEIGQPLPVGLMVVGRRGRDHDLMALAAALEPVLQPSPRTA